MTTDYKAMPKTWATIEQFAANGDEPAACVMELLSRVQRLEAGATCPHIVTGDEGTSYCALAEQVARIGQPDVPANTSAQISQPPSNDRQIRSSLVERVAMAANCYPHENARTAIREVAAWLADQSGTTKSWTFRSVDAGSAAAHWLREEAER